MSTLPEGQHRLHAESFVTRLSATVGQAEAGPDLDTAIRRITDFLNQRLAAGEVGRILETFERVLVSEPRTRVPHRVAPRRGRETALLLVTRQTERPSGCDPFYWG